MFGTSSVNDLAHSVSMDIIGSSFPAWDNTHPKRMISISANELTYTNPTPATGGGNALVILRPVALRET